MRADDLLDILGEIDDVYLETAKEKTKRRKITWVSIGSLAACFLLVLFIPLGFLHGMNQESDIDYLSKDITRFSVYYVDGAVLSDQVYEIHGGYEEMFFAWKKQNGIYENVVLKDIELQAKIQEGYTGSSDSPDVDYILRITISSSFADYMEKDNAELLVESLKKTVASYTGVKISDIELILAES